MTGRPHRGCMPGRQPVRARRGQRAAAHDGRRPDLPGRAECGATPRDGGREDGGTRELRPGPVTHGTSPTARVRADNCLNRAAAAQSVAEHGGAMPITMVFGRRDPGGCRLPHHLRTTCRGSPLGREATELGSTCDADSSSVNGTLPSDNSGSGRAAAADRYTALRFTLGRPGWRVEPRSGAEEDAPIRIATPYPGTEAGRVWRVARGPDGLVVLDEASGVRLCAAPSMRDALVELWEAVTGAVSD